MICFLLKIPENFVCLILHDGFRVGHIPLSSMVKFEFLVQFTVDQLSVPVVSRVVVLLHSFASFARVINRFISFSMSSVLTILFLLIYFRFSIISLYSILFAAIWRDPITFLRMVLRRHVQVFSYAISPFSNIHTVVFFIDFVVHFVRIFLMVLQAAVISPSLFILMYSSSPCIDVTTQSPMVVSHFPSFFLLTHIVNQCHI